MFDELRRITQVEVLVAYTVRLTFNDGTVKKVDLAPYLWGPIFEPVCDLNYFRLVRVEYGTICWPNGANVDPNVLYYDLPTA